jgi:hypothetical protein
MYPALTDYLTDEYDYGNAMLTNYFRTYRRQKIANRTTSEFAQTAFSAVLPPSFALRDSVLQELSSDANTVLLVVDGMGAEYQPLLLSMAKRLGRNVQSATVAAVRLPSSTDYNHIQWDKNRIIEPGIHEVDNISHTGAKKHEKCSAAHNIVATLAVFEDVFNKIAQALSKYDRVVVTADHGSSRLAVLSIEQKFSTTLPWNGDPQDWRFAIAPKNAERPAEFEKADVMCDDGTITTYWVVRGYNRLPKQGGKLSVHGGATLEERLVPIVVFSKTKTVEAQKPIGKPTTEQLVEKMDFDI